MMLSKYVENPGDSSDWEGLRTRCVCMCVCDIGAFVSICKNRSPTNVLLQPTLHINGNMYVGEGSTVGVAYTCSCLALLGSCAVVMRKPTSV